MPQSQPISAYWAPEDVRPVLTALMLTIFLATLDQTIVAVALPAIAKDLGHFEVLSWVMSGFLLTFAIATPVWGKLGDVYGHRRVLLISHAIFALASVMCAAASAMSVLIAGRLLQGIGGAGLMLSAQSVIANIVAPRERGRYMAYISSMIALANAGGPLLGGVLSAQLSWRWIFWINLPLGFAGVLAAYRGLKKLPVPNLRRRIDVPGGALVCIAVGALLLAFTLIGQGASWRDGHVLGLFGLFAVAAALCILYEARVEDPVLPIAFFPVRAIRLCWLLSFVTIFVLFALTFLLPIEAQLTGHGNFHDISMRVIPLTLAMPGGAFLTGQLMMRTGETKPLMTAGLLIAALGLAAYALSPGEGLFYGALCLLMTGLGIGVLFPTTMTSIQNGVGVAHIGTITASVALLRTLGGAVGVALLSAVLLVNLPRGAQIPWEGATLSHAAFDTGSAAQIQAAFQTVYGIMVALLLGTAIVIALAMPAIRLRGRDDHVSLEA